MVQKSFNIKVWLEKLPERMSPTSSSTFGMCLEKKVKSSYDSVLIWHLLLQK